MTPKFFFKNHLNHRYTDTKIFHIITTFPFFFSFSHTRTVPGGFRKKGDGYYYKHYTALRTWDDAQKVCEGQGGSLAIIWNKKTSEVVRSMMADGWIGGNDKRKEKDWRTPNVPWVRTTSLTLSYFKVRT